MTEETAKELASAINRLADCLQALKGGSLNPGINIYHHNGPQYPQSQPTYPFSPTVWCGPAIANTGGN